MSIPNTRRDYNKSDADLAQIIDDILHSGRRDIVRLADYGVTEEWLQSIEDANMAFKLCPPDEFWAGALVNATYNKNLKREEVLKMTRQISERARIRFGDNTGILMQFATTALARQTDNDLVRTGREVVYAATLYATELAQEGLTALMITDYAAMVEDFDDLIDLQKRKIKERDKAVEDRIKLGNTAYALLVKLSAKGKLCWQDESEALYNDYVIYPSSHKVQSIIEGNIESGVVVNTSVHDATAGSVITMKNTGNVPLSFFYALQPTDITGPMPRIVQPSEEVSETAANLGFSEQLQRFNVYNDSPESGSYRIEW